MWLNQTSAPAETPVTLADAKTHLRVTHSNDDDFITALIDAVTAHLDGRRGYLGRCLVTQSWEYRVNVFPGNGIIEIPLPPLVSVESVKYIDDAGSEQTMSSAEYVVDTATVNGQVRLGYDEDWPTTRDEDFAVRVAFTAGFGAASDVPQPIKSAIYMMVAHLYVNREVTGAGDIGELPLGARYLLSAYRVIGY